MKDDNVVDTEVMSENTHNNQTSADQAQASNSVTEEAESTETHWKEKILSAEHWLRFVFMVLFAVIAVVASYVVAVLIVIQFVFALVTGNSQDKLRTFGADLSQYIFQILSFLTYNSEEKPFPFADWPQVMVPEDDTSATEK